MEIYVIIDTEENYTEGIFLELEDAKEYLKNNISEEFQNDFIIDIVVFIDDKKIQELNRKTVDYLADKNI